MPVVEYCKDEDELLDQPSKKYHHEMSDESDGYNVIVTVPSKVFIRLHRLVEVNF